MANQGRYRATEFLLVNYSNAQETAPHQYSYSVKDALSMQHVTHITRDRGVFRDTPMRRAAERRTLSRWAVIFRGMS